VLGGNFLDVVSESERGRNDEAGEKGAEFHGSELFLPGAAGRRAAVGDGGGGGVALSTVSRSADAWLRRFQTGPESSVALIAPEHRPAL
jgi:hypothetical protein